MTLRVFRSRAAALLAMLAMALQAFWPLLARSKPADPALLVEVCTIEGVTHYVHLPSAKTPLEQRCELQHEHCQFCMFGSTQIATLDAWAPPSRAIAPTSAKPGDLALGAARASQRSPLAQPRAPPRSS